MAEQAVGACLSDQIVSAEAEAVFDPDRVGNDRASARQIDGAIGEDDPLDPDQDVARRAAADDVQGAALDRHR